MSFVNFAVDKYKVSTDYTRMKKNSPMKHSNDNRNKFQCSSIKVLNTYILRKL